MFSYTLKRILGILWTEKVPNTDVLLRANAQGMESMLVWNQLRRVGQVCRMNDRRIPEQLLYGRLKLGKRKPGRQKLRYQDAMKINLCSLNLFSRSWEKSTNDRIEWRKIVWAGTHKHQQLRIDQRKEKCATRKAATAPPTAEIANWQCDECGRICYSRIELFSHKRIFLFFFCIISYIYEQKINLYAVSWSQARVLECIYVYVCMLADSLGRLNTINPPTLFFRSYSFGFTPDMRYMNGTTVSAVQSSYKILSYRRPMASARVTGKSLIGCRQPWLRNTLKLVCWL